ncbi:hypothetical protein ACQ4M4_06135 [Leptolyngbya sp. AN02str]|uniref:hypothetical protein n=1 Tax=Leptolyngbya sp. AN02str TaxID=3423363 RepID=UPI003D320B8E
MVSKVYKCRNHKDHKFHKSYKFRKSRKNSRFQDKSTECNPVEISAPTPKLTNEFLSTFLEVPKSQNPLAEENEGVIDDIPQTGKVHFLGGVFDDITTPGSPGLIQRSVTVGSHQSLVMPIIQQSVDNVGWNFTGFPGYEAPAPHVLTTEEQKFINEKVIDTVTGLNFSLDGKSLIRDCDWEKYRVASSSPYTWDVPETDDITNYRGGPYPDSWIEQPYTQGVQDGYWVQLDNLSIGSHTIHFTGTVNYQKIDATVDYNNSGSIGDHPVEALLQYLSTLGSATQQIKYQVNVVSACQYNNMFL